MNIFLKENEDPAREPVRGRYEAVAADVAARHHRAMGRAVRFATGADEHGQKIEAAAKQ